LRGILLHYFIFKKSAAEAHRILVETYDDHALFETTCIDWFRCSKNNDFDAEGIKRSGVPKKFEDEELEALLHEDPCQMLAELEESLGVDHATVSKLLEVSEMIEKQGHWVPYEPRGVFSCVNSCFNSKKEKIFLHRIVIGDEKWIR